MLASSNYILFDHTKIQWFIMGLIIGSYLHFLTVVLMVVLGIIIDNRPLPSILGGNSPQQFIIVILNSIKETWRDAVIRGDEKSFKYQQ